MTFFVSVKILYARIINPFVLNHLKKCTLNAEVTEIIVSFSILHDAVFEWKQYEDVGPVNLYK